MIKTNLGNINILINGLEKGKDLLRVKPDGSFISLYPGADSFRISNLH